MTCASLKPGFEKVSLHFDLDIGSGLIRSLLQLYVDKFVFTCSGGACARYLCALTQPPED